MRSSRRREPKAAFPELPPGIQTGLNRLVADNAKTVAKMLQCDASSSVNVLCEKCAGVMKLNQLSPSSFLARFFDMELLRKHAVLLNKSGKGTTVVLSERIATAWAKNQVPPMNTDAPDQTDGSPKPRKGKRAVEHSEGCAENETFSIHLASAKKKKSEQI